MEGISVVELKYSDISELNSLKPDDWPNITEIHGHYLKTKCCKCIKVLNTENKTLGIGTGIAFNKTGWLGHIIVSKDYQRKGIGTVIVQDRIKYLLESCHCQAITLTATDQGYPVYKKLGFFEESMYVIMIRPQEYKISNITNENIKKANDEHFKEILMIDRVTSGENREELLKPILNNGYVYIKDSTVQGFYLPQFGDSGVSALTEEAGTALLGERIKEEKRIYVPEENTISYKFLIDNGYMEIKRIHRMILGNPFIHNLRNSYSRIGGFAG